MDPLTRVIRHDYVFFDEIYFADSTLVFHWAVVNINYTKFKDDRKLRYTPFVMRDYI